jgi:hypothetical protein
MKHGHIASEEVSQVWYSGTAWVVVDDAKAPNGVAVYRAGYFGKIRCRLWGLRHGYGWLKVK